MKYFSKILLMVPLLFLSGCYTQIAYRDSSDDRNQNNYQDTSTQTNDAGNSEFLAPVCNVVEEPVVDLNAVGVTYNPYNQAGVQSKTKTDQNINVKSGNGSGPASKPDTRIRVNTSPGNTSTTTTRTRDNGQTSPPNREKSKN
jgi:hypothetical protein